MELCAVGNAGKWQLSAVAGILFYLFSSPMSFDISQRILGLVGLDIDKSNIAIRIMHALLLMLVFRGLLELKNRKCQMFSSNSMWIQSATAAVVYLIVFNHYVVEALGSCCEFAGFKLADSPIIAYMVLVAIYIVIMRLVIN